MLTCTLCTKCNVQNVNVNIVNLSTVTTNSQIVDNRHNTSSSILYPSFCWALRIPIILSPCGDYDSLNNVHSACDDSQSTNRASIINAAVSNIWPAYPFHVARNKNTF